MARLQKPTGRLVLRMPDVPAAAVIRDCVATDVEYRLIGRDTVDALKNKNITDPSNTVAAKLLNISGVNYEIRGTPTAGDVLTNISPGVLGWTSVALPEPVQEIQVFELDPPELQLTELILPDLMLADVPPQAAADVPPESVDVSPPQASPQSTDVSPPPLEPSQSADASPPPEPMRESPAHPQMLLPIQTQVLHVTSGGSDSTGNGTLGNPYLTIQHAVGTITDASFNKRYTINVGPGDYAGALVVRSWVFIVGAGVLVTRINGDISIADASWADGGVNNDVRGGFCDCSLRGASVAIDFTFGATSPYGKFYFSNCWVNVAPVITGVSAANQVVIEDGLWFAGMVATAVAVTTSGWFNQNGAVVVNSATTATLYTASNSTNLGNLIINNNAGVPPVVTLFGSPTSGNITVANGANLSATSNSLPVRAKISGAVSLLSDAAGVGYNPTPAIRPKWSKVPADLQTAIDRLVSAVYTLNGGVPL